MAGPDGRIGQTGPRGSAQRHHRKPRTAARQLQAKGYSLPARRHRSHSPTCWTVTNGDLFDALKATRAELHGAYALAVMHKDEPHRVVARAGSP
jgi:hypothetical protein